MRFTQSEIAQVQLEESISQHLNGNYIAAITLAGAAEEILRKLLPPDKDNALHKLITTLKRDHPDLSLLNEMGDCVEDKDGNIKTIKNAVDKDIIDYLNGTRNSLKHHKENMPFIEIAPVEESLAMISRALFNYLMLSLPHSDKIDRGFHLIVHLSRDDDFLNHPHHTA